MDIRIHYFGKLAEMAGCEKETVETESNSIIEILEELNENLPNLKNQLFALFLNNKKVIDYNQLVQNNDEICLMPPFAGG